GRRRYRARWLGGLSIPLLHMPWSPVTDRIPGGSFTTVAIALGLGMLLVVFDQARARARRLSVLNRLTSAIVSAQQYGNMVQTALEELQRLTKVKAAWFRLLEGGHMVATHAVGTSPDFLRDAGFTQVTEEISKMLDRSQPQVAKSEALGTETLESLKAEKIRYAVMLPVVGKKSPIGVLLLGTRKSIDWTPEELEFLQ